jgi:hypothetical protein
MWHQSIYVRSIIVPYIVLLLSFLLTSSRVKKFQSDRIDADVPLPGGDFCRPVRSPWCRDAPTRARTAIRANAICSSLSGRLHGAAARRSPVLRDFIEAVTPVNEAALNPTLRADGGGVGSS